MKKRIITSAFALMFTLPVMAQKTVWFTGLGRAVVQNDELVDTSTNKGKGSQGYTLFDLGVNAQSGKDLKAHAILRVRNEFGGFFGDGTSLEFRQMRLTGLIGKIVKYEIGDLDVNLTPYTIHNYEEIYNDYESELFRIKRDVVAYENFYTDDNTWRMQGVNAFTTLKFEPEFLDQLYIRAFGNRIAATDNLANPDRWLFGGALKLKQSDKLSLGANIVNISDMAGTLKNASTFDYDNLVVTGDLTVTALDNDDYKAGLMVEGGISDYTIVETTSDSSTQKDDYFYDARLMGKYKKLNIGLELGYRNVGANFNSPSAQSRRINPTSSTNDIFPNYLNGTTRGMTLFDRYSSEADMYNRAVSTTLGTFLPQFNNVLPYGPATPNRKGLSVKATYSDPDKIAKVDVTYDMLSEVVGEGTTGGSDALRNFTMIRAGGSINIAKAIEWEKTAMVHVGFKSESTSRTTNPIDFSSTLIDAGIDLEVLKKFDILLGYKSLSAKGNEIMAVRNQFNEATSFDNTTYADFDVEEQILAIGAKYKFSKKAFFSMMGHLVDYTDNKNANADYDLNQIYFIYQLKF